MKKVTFSLEDRIAKIEEQMEKQQKKKKKPKDFWDKLQAVSSLISGLVVVIVAYFLTGSVNQALQERQLELSNLTAMRELMVKLGSPDISLPDAEATTITLAAFGKYAVVPLINQLQSERDIKVLAAEKGLRVLSLTHRAEVCESLMAILKNRTRLFTWQTHRRAIGLIGDINCVPAKPLLEQYAELIRRGTTKEGLEAYRDIVQEDPPPTFESIDLIRSELERAQKILGKI